MIFWPILAVLAASARSGPQADPDPFDPYDRCEPLPHEGCDASGSEAEIDPVLEADLVLGRVEPLDVRDVYRQGCEPLHDIDCEGDGCWAPSIRGTFFTRLSESPWDYWEDPTPRPRSPGWPGWPHARATPEKKAKRKAVEKARRRNR